MARYVADVQHGIACVDDNDNLVCAGCHAASDEDHQLALWGGTYVCPLCFRTWRDWYEGSDLQRARAEVVTHA